MSVSGVPSSGDGGPEAALACAREGRQVLPIWPVRDGACACGGPKVNPTCRPGKHPAVRGGHKSATTDERRIREWWRRWPDANLAVATGRRSGLLVVDADGEDGVRHLGELEARHGKLPPTRTVRSAGGGVHLHFEFPCDLQDGCDVRNSASRLAPRVDVRGEGGYVICPPSRRGEASYEWVDARPPARPPGWLIELASTSGGSNEGSTGREGGAIRAHVLDGEVIPEGTRNDTLYRLGCSMRARGAEAEEILVQLIRINSTRCSPTLTEAEVELCASSAATHPKGEAGPREPGFEVQSALDLYWEVVEAHDFAGKGGRSCKDVLVVLAGLARRHGRLIPSGVRVSVGVRDLALEAAVSKQTVFKAIARLRMAGLLRRDDVDRAPREAGAFVLVLPEGAKVDHTTSRGCADIDTPACGQDSRASGAPRLRWSAPGARRLGKTAGATIDALLDRGGSASVRELADALGRGRYRDFRRRVVARLEEAGVVELADGGVVALVPNWREVLESERATGREIEAARRDARKYAEERRRYALQVGFGSDAFDGEEAEPSVPDPRPPGPHEVPRDGGECSPADSDGYVTGPAEVFEMARRLLDGGRGASPVSQHRPCREDLRRAWADPRKAAFFDEVREADRRARARRPRPSNRPSVASSDSRARER